MYMYAEDCAIRTEKTILIRIDSVKFLRKMRTNKQFMEYILTSVLIIDTNQYVT